MWHGETLSFFKHSPINWKHSRPSSMNFHLSQHDATTSSPLLFDVDSLTGSEFVLLARSRREGGNSPKIYFSGGSQGQTPFFYLTDDHTTLFQAPKKAALKFLHRIQNQRFCMKHGRLPLKNHQEPFLATVKRCKLVWLGHVTQHDVLLVGSSG